MDYKYAFYKQKGARSMKKQWKFLSCLLTATMLCTATACQLDKKIVSAEISKDYTRTTTQQGSVTKEFQQKTAAFAFSMFHNSVNKQQSNHLLSPLSATLCLALINNGAAGNTRAQIENAIGLSTDQLNSSMYAYTSSLYTGEDCKVSLANSIWMKDGALNVKPTFLQANADWYQAQAYASPFDSTTLSDINNWCYNHTDGKIDKILDSIDPLDVMYLINAVDFDAKWETEYERSDIENGVFYNYDGTQSDVKMLYSTQYRYLLDETCVGFAKNYKGGKYSFVGLLPNEGTDIYDFVNTLNEETWTTLWDSTKDNPERKVHIRMPEFTYETEMPLNSALNALDIEDMFSPTLADFSGIDDTQPLYCSYVKQKAFIQVDRNGTKAAAVTLGGFKAMAIAPLAPLYITLDRPFVYAIVDNEYKLPLFLGMVSHL